MGGFIGFRPVVPHDLGRRLLSAATLPLVLVMSAGAGMHAAQTVRSAHPGIVSRASALQRLQRFEDRTALRLAPATTAPVALAQPPPAPLRDHEVFGFAPYWTLDAVAGYDYAHLTTISYFGVDVNPDGSVLQAGPGWNGYQSQQLVDMIDRAHAAGIKVVLTAKDFDAAGLRAITTDPAAAPRLASVLKSLVQEKRMDGVNLDFEGQDGGGRAAFSAFANTVATGLRQAHPEWQLSIDTYGASAGNPDNWYDVTALAPKFDALFVMGYDMYDPGAASPNASLAADAEYMANYVAAIGAGKVILGVPFYGYDWPTRDEHPLAKATGDPQPVSYAELLSQGHRPFWDAGAAVPWTAYRAGAQWHEVYYDDPQSIAMKARLVAQDGLRGIGAWALGMDGNDWRMQAALLGQASGGAYAPDPRSGGPTPGPSASPGGPSPTPSPNPTPGGGPGGPLPSPNPSPGARPGPSPSPSPCPSPSPALPGLPPPPSLCKPAGTP